MVAGQPGHWTWTAILIIIVVGLSLCILPTSSAKTQSSTEWKRKPGDVADEPTKEGTAHNNVHHSPRKNHHHHHRLHHHKHNNAKRASKHPHSTRAPQVSRSNNNSSTKWTQAQTNDGLTPWSPWSKCSKKCRQTRHRKCIQPPPLLTNDDDTGRQKSVKECEETQVLRQERPCRNKGRCKRGSKAFHVVLPPKKESLKPVAPSSGAGNNQQQSDVRVLLSLNSIFYSSWSRWSTCSKACTTTRYRTCRFQVVCGNTVLHEEAYCYMEGTDCEKWYSGGARYHREEDSVEQNSKPRPERGQQRANHKNNQTSTNNSGSNSSSGNKDEPGDLVVTDSPSRVECGISAGGSSWSSPYNLQLRIIGGREATPGKWPWQVAILNRFKEAFCGGTLIGARWVLTAAHCLRKRLYVRIGEYDLVEDDGTEIDFNVEEVFVHPDYDPETVDNDVALLRLPKAIRLSDDHQGVGNARLACLPQPGQSLPITQKCTIIGWGKERSSNVFGTEVLHEAEVPIVKTSACREVYEDYFITDNMFCAGYRKGRIDSCAGDSGGPLLCQVGDRWTIFGITSFGEGCGKRGKYGIYTKVPNYVSWIQRVIDLNGGIQ